MLISSEKSESYISPSPITYSVPLLYNTAFALSPHFHVQLSIGAVTVQFCRKQASVLLAKRYFIPFFFRAAIIYIFNVIAFVKCFIYYFYKRAWQLNGFEVLAVCESRGFDNSYVIWYGYVLKTAALIKGLGF